ncbi:DNA-3-methyladenine glycosylase family protein [Paenibacillus cremeus]|uniref:DNA-3-methyladenine glycosylase II n=1 Tax=Paenibacillus cremeus TaxID=2163881 RepID=A0A559KDF4_9BACL|nr:DNA-3-methyladenine glycosylase [Paenibacillus cremeus]TVY10134.1 DNA-3-methyladenine glycosylase 2 family protein [Paenibacillus cremeus]
MTEIILYPKAPYDFSKIIGRIQGVKHEMYRLEGESLCRTIRLDSGARLIRTRSVGTIGEPQLQVEVQGELLEKDQRQLTTSLERMLSVSVDLNPFYSHMKSVGQEWNAICERFVGLPLVLEADLFECMCKTIIGQQLNLAFASELDKRLMQLTTEPIELAGISYPVFPSPEQVARLEYEQLQALQFSRRKAEYVIDWARKVADGTVDLDALYAFSNEEIVERLTRLRGVGRWSVECFLLFGMGRTDLLPAADIGLRNALKKLYRLDEQPKEDEVRRMGAAWTPWSSYATFYLWESLHDED